MGVSRAIVKNNGGEQLKFDLRLPGKLTRTGWELPKKLSLEDWIACGQSLGKIEVAVQWWLGDWWAYGEFAYGERKALFEEGGPLEELSFETIKQYGWVARSVETCDRSHALSWKHHFNVAEMSPAQQRKWLDRAVREDWSSNQLKSAITRAAAIEKTQAADIEAGKLGRFAVLYADPPWQYEHPPMGGTNRSIENHYPTMLLDEICALPVAEIAHADSVLFMWATNPKLYECMKVLDAWGFEYRTDMVWIKDKIGMGYYVRGKHESLLIARRGALPVPTEDNRPDSVIEAPRLEHSAKPEIVYDIIDRMYPEIRKIELFSRARAARALWTVWGNQAVAA
jgi:N6-adenosine-specific RNA methylase IME4